MEENNQEQTVEVKEENKHICFKNHCWKMCLGMVLAAFLGGFLATYCVADQIAERSQQKVIIPSSVGFDQKMFDDFDKDITKEIKQEIKQINKIMKRNGIPDFNREVFDMEPINMPETVKIESELKKDNYNVEVSLKPFQNDESKVNYNVSGKKLTVYGESKIQDEKNQQEISFSHDFILPENADTMNIKKEIQGDKLIISVPLKN